MYFSAGFRAKESPRGASLGCSTIKFNLSSMIQFDCAPGEIEPFSKAVRQLSNLEYSSILTTEVSSERGLFGRCWWIWEEQIFKGKTRFSVRHAMPRGANKWSFELSCCMRVGAWVNVSLSLCVRLLVCQIDREANCCFISNKSTQSDLLENGLPGGFDVHWLVCFVEQTKTYNSTDLLHFNRFHTIFLRIVVE